MKNQMNRRDVLALGTLAGYRPAATTLAAVAAGWAVTPAAAQTPSWSGPEFDVPRPELVLELVVTCSKPETLGPDTASKDEQRRSIWPIIGGKFAGNGIRGVVVPGGGDFPVTRPDGVTVVDALYRLRTDDGVTIIIHNKGLAIPSDQSGGRSRYRLTPEFTAPQGKYDWLNKQIFIANLTTTIPDGKRLARDENENDRLIRVYRIA